jgi:glucosamine--fructose-6-phosphate aminotransferase (isomerizing)
MCGIVGILGEEPVASSIIGALKRLEYRGYDSAGIATLEGGRLERRRAEGKLRNLELRLSQQPLKGAIGIGHTRWATHGGPTEKNAHPHVTDRLAVVHNGIIENFQDLRREMKSKGHIFSTDTDTEVIAHLVTESLRNGLGPVDAVEASLPRLKGTFALAFLFEGEEDLLIGARLGAPLVVGFGEGSDMFLGSDALALAPFTDTMVYLEDGDWVVIRRGQCELRDNANALVHRPKIKMQPTAFLAEKGNHRHFMAKEIHEQPEVVGRTLAHYLDISTGSVRLPFELPLDPKELKSLTIVACGTAYYGGLIGKYWIERFARLPVEIDVASEYRYREAPLPGDGLMLVISQSGETADTLAAQRYAKSRNQKIVSIVNVPSSTIARESDIAALTLAGPEIGVASTKAFSCQLAVLASLAIALGCARGTINRETEQRLVKELMLIPGLMADTMKLEPSIEPIAHKLSKARDALYVGRGACYPLALEGALKLKETSYIHAEGYAAGELKHGPIALIDNSMPVIVLAPLDSTLEKTVSNLQEVAARGGRIIFVGSQKTAREVAVDLAGMIEMPEMASNFAPIVYAVPIQLLAYHTAVFMGKDVDQPRNLAKCVTVE